MKGGPFGDNNKFSKKSHNVGNTYGDSLVSAGIAYYAKKKFWSNELI